MNRLTLLSRAYCSLCEAMVRQAAAVAGTYGMDIEVIDVDAHPALLERWDTLVPVLFLGTAEPEHELCHHQFDAQRVTSAVERSRTRAEGAQIS